MARPVNIDVLDQIVNVSRGIGVHRHLVCDISEEMEALVTEYERRMEEYSAGLRSGTAPKDKRAVLPKAFRFRRALEMWTGFLYGQPVWRCVGRRGVESDLNALIEVYAVALKYKHYDAQDTSMDAIRDAIVNHGEDLWNPFELILGMCDWTSLPVKLLMDHVVYGKGVARAKKWVDMHLFVTPDDESRVLEHELCQMYLSKAVKESVGDEPPNLTARCRYHSHTEHGLPCYLDN